MPSFSVMESSITNSISSQQCICIDSELCLLKWLKFLKCQMRMASKLTRKTRAAKESNKEVFLGFSQFSGHFREGFLVCQCQTIFHWIFVIQCYVLLWFSFKKYIVLYSWAFQFTAGMTNWVFSKIMLPYIL